MLKNITLALALTIMALTNLHGQALELKAGDESEKNAPNGKSWVWKTDNGYTAVLQDFNPVIITSLKTKFRWIKYSKQLGLVKKTEFNIKEDKAEIRLLEKLPSKSANVFLGSSISLLEGKVKYYIVKLSESETGEIESTVNLLGSLSLSANGKTASVDTKINYHTVTIKYSPDSSKLIMLFNYPPREIIEAHGFHPVFFVVNANYKLLWQYKYKLPAYRGINPIILNDGTVYLNLDLIKRIDAYSTTILSCEAHFLCLRDGSVINDVTLTNPAGYDVTASSMVLLKESNDVFIVGAYQNKNGIIGTATTKVTDEQLFDSWSLHPFPAKIKSMCLSQKEIDAKKGIQRICNPLLIEQIKDNKILIGFEFIIVDYKLSGPSKGMYEFFKDESYFASFNSDGAINWETAIEDRLDFQYMQSTYLFPTSDPWSLAFKEMNSEIKGDNLLLIFNADESWLIEKNAKSGKNPEKVSKIAPTYCSIDLNTGEMKRSKIKLLGAISELKTQTMATELNKNVAIGDPIFTINFLRNKVGIGFLQYK